MTRPDVKQKCFGDFLDWSLTTLSQTNDKSITDTMVLDGVLQSLVNTQSFITLTLQLIFLCSHASEYVAAICSMPKKLKSVRFHTEYGLGRREVCLSSGRYLPNHVVCGNRPFAYSLKLNSVSIIGIIILPKCFMHKLVRPRNTSLIRKEFQKLLFKNY